LSNYWCGECGAVLAALFGWQPHSTADCLAQQQINLSHNWQVVGVNNMVYRCRCCGVHSSHLKNDNIKRLFSPFSCKETQMRRALI
jgi:hypothetical protein